MRVASRAALPYVVAGLVLGGLWALRSGAPLWQHALRAAVVLIVGPPLLLRVQARRLARQGDALPPQPSVAKLVVVKVCLVLAALLASWQLRGVLPHPDVWVGLGLFIAVTVVGVFFHEHMLAAAPVSQRGSQASSASISLRT